MVKAKRQIVETVGVEVGSSVRPMPAAPSYGPYPPRFSNPPPLSAFLEPDAPRDDWQEAAELGRSLGRALVVGAGLGVLVAGIIDGAKRRPAKVRGR